MFLDKQSPESKEYYAKMLKIFGALSRLFSANNTPYLSYRLTENLFCKSFQAKNLSRSDVSADASKDNIGIGVKTFLFSNGSSFQKVAEFNKERERIVSKSSTEDKVKEIISMRNERINFTLKSHGLDSMLYHLITRQTGKISIFEESINTINNDLIISSSIVDDGKTLKFKDNIHEYNFNYSKSVLMQRFNTLNPLLEVPIVILEDPFEMLERLLQDSGNIPQQTQYINRVFLPLYSPGVQEVQKKSGLNQWNASGRTRNVNEIYIPIPIWIHKCFEGFFPPRDQHFNLKLPNGKILKSKVCQEGGKALMSSPNKDLGEWLLREVLELSEGELLTYDKLQKVGVDTVGIYKVSNTDYEMSFNSLGTYEEFELSYKN